MIARFTSLVSIILLTSVTAQAQFFGGGPSSGSFNRFAGSVGFGVAQFSVISPERDFRMDEGNYVYLGVEREIGKTGLFITFSANFMSSDGQTFYDYTRLDGSRYATNAGSDIDFDSEHWQLGVGFKFKLFPTGWFRPYGEGGGLFGYHTIKYNNSSSGIVPQGAAAPGGEKLEDSLTGFGYYMEAGLEIDFTDTFGIRPAYRYQITETRTFDTLADNKVKYEARIFQFALGLKF